MSRLLLAPGAQVPLAVTSFVAAVAVLAGAFVAPDRVDPPVGAAIAVLLLLNGIARLVLWLNRSRMP